MSTLPTRKRLPHRPPDFVLASEAMFFITICCEPRNRNQLCHPEIARILFDAARFYEKRDDWSVRVLLLMPDHVHFLAKFALGVGMKKLIESWKRFTATNAGICWQRDFFDHRVRHNESLDAKADYIRQNPVRAGLIAKAEDWPYRIEAIR